MAWTSIGRLELHQHVCDSEHFPMEGRNLNPEPEMCMTRICQIGARDRKSYEPRSRHRPGCEETDRPKQSKQGQL